MRTPRIDKGLGLIAAALVITAMLPALVRSQMDITHLDDPAFENDQRPPAVFNHDEHNAAAQLEEQCWYCHHMDGAAPSEDEDSIGIPCADCHAVDAEEVTPLMQAYHKQCGDCHVEQQKGPITCGECHVRQ